jgi:hypothetical protein
MWIKCLRFAGALAWRWLSGSGQNMISGTDNENRQLQNRQAKFPTITVGGLVDNLFGNS